MLLKPFLRLWNPDGRLYLTRWVLAENPLFGVYLHKIEAPDPDRHLHNHPWTALVLLLRGSYIQTNYFNTHERVKWFNVLGRKYHKITHINGPVWSLVIHGPRHEHDWSFLVNDRPMPWWQYVKYIQAPQNIRMEGGR